jgi:MOSC domain-containing protein YiiM
MSTAAVGRVEAMGKIVGVWTSPARNSGRMDGHESRQAIVGGGLEGCAHANPPKREVLFASKEHLDSVGVEPGVVRENLTVEGDDVQAWPIGQRVRVGGAVFEITMVCDPCQRMDAIREGLRTEIDGKRGMLARVVEAGEVTVGDPVELI